jgi:cysteine desulfurase/selenocysteine lyase
MPVDPETIRRDFPVLQSTLDGRPIVYMDSANMSLKPLPVLKAMEDYYLHYPSSAGRSVHRLSARVETARKNARDTIRRFVRARHVEEILFTRNTTEGLNLVLNSLPWRVGDVVLTTDREHNSSLLPCQLLSERRGVNHVIVQSDVDHRFDMQAFEQALTPQVRLVSFVYTSNLDGYTLPVHKIIQKAHQYGALVLLDAAQAAPHHPIDVQKLDVDFLAFSGHKMLGPTGTGILYVKRSHYATLQPFIVGGETVEWTTYDRHRFLKPPEKFEAGLQNYAGELGLAAAATYLQSIGLNTIAAHERALTRRMHDGLSAIEGVRIVGVQHPDLRCGITSFTIDGVHYHDVAMILDSNFNIMVRSGQHCVHSWFAAHGIRGSVRASLYLYNTLDEVDALVDAVVEISKLR